MGMTQGQNINNTAEIKRHSFKHDNGQKKQSNSTCHIAYNSGCAHDELAKFYRTTITIQETRKKTGNTKTTTHIKAIQNATRFEDSNAQQSP